MSYKRKIGGAVLALALVAGAIPGTISSASAVETGQMKICLGSDGKHHPCNRGSPVVLALVVAASVAGIYLLVQGSSDRPTSP